MKRLSDVQRLAVRHRPDGQPVMHQSWGKLLFLHWRIPPEMLRPQVPDELEIDTFGNSAWVAITPFTMWDIRAFPPYVPAIPGFSSMHELNARTYVHLNGVPGVWFFSLDTNSAAAALAARNFFFLPYHTAEIELEQNGNTIDYSLDRAEEQHAYFQASWTVGEPLPKSQPGTREFFLTERYCLFAENEGEIYRARIHHEPWQLYKAEVSELKTNILEVNGLPRRKTQPLVHYADEISVDIWMLEDPYEPLEPEQED